MVTTACEQHSLSQQDYRFSRRELREVVKWSDTALKVHLARLVELEYVLVHRAKAGRYDYELLFDGNANNDVHLMGLIDVQALTKKSPFTVKPATQKDQYDGNRSGQNAPWSDSSQGMVSTQSVPEKSPKPINGVALNQTGQGSRENTLQA